MKKKLFYFGLSLLSLIAVSSIDFSKSYAQTSATCYSSDMYLCRGCSIGGLQRNYKQVTFCTPIDPVEISAESN